MGRKACEVSLTDFRENTVAAEADSLYEAAALAIQRLKACDWIEALGVGSQLEIEARLPSMRHRMSVGAGAPLVRVDGCNGRADAAEG